MFYAEDDISELLNCPNCKKRYRDPRSLPCGETICDDCIEYLSISTGDSNTLNCPYCKETHRIPESGFANKLILKLIEKSHEVYRSKEFDDLKPKLKIIDDMYK